MLRQQIKELEVLRTSEESNAEEQPEVRVIFAERLDTSREFWQTYLHEARN